MSEVNTDIAFKYICHNCSREVWMWFPNDDLRNVLQAILYGRWPHGICPYCGYLNECDIEYLERENV